MNAPIYLPLARSAVDRDYLSREREGLFDELWANSDTRVLVMHDHKVLLKGTAGDPKPVLKLLSTTDTPLAQLLVYLGKSTEASPGEPVGTPIVLAVLSPTTAEMLEPDANAWHSLRHTGAGLDSRDSGIYSQALALANWHETHLHCSRCGTATVIEKAGWVRRCLKDDHQIFPRTDPAIIVSVIDDQDRLLLGSQGIWEENRWSILAGFVEPGESLAAAVIREMHEEAGVHVIDPVFLGSQSWPFPYSLMVGFTAKIDPEHAGRDLVPDGDEIEKLRWFSREEIAAEAKDLLLPGYLSISRALIEHWYGGPIISATELNAAR